jgi:hypothetical protein
VRHLARNTATITEIFIIRRSLPLAVQLIHPPVTDRCVSAGGGLGEGNILAQPHLQQFDFD